MELPLKPTSPPTALGLPPVPVNGARRIDL